MGSAAFGGAQFNTNLQIPSRNWAFISLTEQKQAFSIIKQRSKPVTVFCLACRVFKYWEISHKNTDFRLLLENGKGWQLWGHWVTAVSFRGVVLWLLVTTGSLTLALLRARCHLSGLFRNESTKPCSKAILPSFKCKSDWWDCISYCARHTSTFPTVPGTWHSECVSLSSSMMDKWMTSSQEESEFEWQETCPTATEVQAYECFSSLLSDRCSSLYLLLICCAMKILLVVTDDFESCLTFQEQMCWWFNRI